MSLQITPKTEARINALADASGLSVDEYLSLLVNKQTHREESALSREAPASGSSDRVWDFIAASMTDVPREDLAALPKDGLDQIDHYVYGIPKITP